MQAEANDDSAAAFDEYGRAATGKLGDRLSETSLAVQLTHAVSNVYQARYNFGSGGIFVRWFLTPLPPSSQGTAPQRAMWMQEGIADAMKNGNRLRTSVQSIGFTPQDRARFENDLRGLLLSSFLCAFLPSDHLRIFKRLHEMRVTLEVRTLTAVSSISIDLQG